MAVTRARPAVAGDELLTIEEAMELTRQTRKALSARRYRRMGPPFIKRGRVILYRRSEVERWLAAGEIETADE